MKRPRCSDVDVAAQKLDQVEPQARQVEQCKAFFEFHEEVDVTLIGSLAPRHRAEHSGPHDTTPTHGRADLRAERINRGAHGSNLHPPQFAAEGPARPVSSRSSIGNTSHGVVLSGGAQGVGMTNVRWPAGMRSPVFALLVTFLAACESGGPEGAAKAVSDSAGVRIAVYSRADRPAPIPAQAYAIDTLEVEETLRIGLLEGDARYVLGSVVSAAVDSSGVVWIADQLASTIRRYDQLGRFVGSVGRKGEGPGEFLSITGVRALPDGHVAVLDPMNRRVSVFNGSGTLARTIPVPVTGLRGGADALEVGPGGALYVIDFSLERRRPKEESRWLVVAPSGEIVDTLEAAPSERFGYAHPVRTVSTPSPTGTLVTGRNVTLRFCDKHAQRERCVSAEHRPIRYHPEERAEVQEFERALATMRGASPQRIGSSKPAWSQLYADQFQRVWARAYQPGVRVGPSAGHSRRAAELGLPVRTWGEGTAFYVVSMVTGQAGIVRFPHRPVAGVTMIRLLAFEQRAVWVAERGEYDEEYVVRYRLKGERGSLFP